MTAVIYARYSTDSQREESIEGQIRECTAYAEKNGFTVVKHYIDRAISAKTDNRPQFQQMIKDSEREASLTSCIVWKLDRFARNRYDSARYKTQLKRERREAGVGYGGHLGWPGGHYSGIGAGRLCRILLG